MGTFCLKPFKSENYLKFSWLRRVVVALLCVGVSPPTPLICQPVWFWRNIVITHSRSPWVMSRIVTGHGRKIQSPLHLPHWVMTTECRNTTPLMSKIIGHTNFHVASSVNWQEIINSICPLSKVLSIFDMEAWGVELRPRRESASMRPCSTRLHLIRRDAGEGVGGAFVLTDFPL